ncbi:MAG: TIGR00730 family Rossman fold protein [Rubrivivax sp.]|nr:TIGR00730 family Rossman fold protein [Rubrivivax sp.]
MKAHEQPGALRVCVYCGSRHGREPAYTAAARELGQAIGQRGWHLVYGGGHVGLMGEVADATLAAGGRAIGVITEALMQREVGHRGLSELHVVSTMHERKRMMAERADLFVALPGGIGTMEELFEVWTWQQLGYHDQPIGLLNVAGYYDGFLQFCDRMVTEGFLARAQRDSLLTHTEPRSLLQALAERLAAQGSKGDDFTRI